MTELVVRWGDEPTLVRYHMLPDDVAVSAAGALVADAVNSAASIRVDDEMHGTRRLTVVIDR